MSYSPKLGSAFNKTRLRDPEHPTTCSGMCSVCGECPGLCEIGLAAVRGADTVYPTAGGIYQYGSEKDYPVDLSHFNITDGYSALWAHLSARRRPLCSM